MSIDKRKLHSFFYVNGLKYLYHCNTIVTSCSFIQQGGLLSRRQVENRQLKHTPRISNSINNKFDTSNDIPVDTSNLGRFYAKLNCHGPVCFVMSIDILLDDKFPDIYVNNIHQDDVDNINPFESNCNQIKMLSFKNCNDIIPFNPYLKEIIVDYPKTYDMDINILIDNGIKYFKNSIQHSKFHRPIDYYNYTIEPSKYNIDLFFNPNQES